MIRVVRALKRRENKYQAGVCERGDSEVFAYKIMQTEPGRHCIDCPRGGRRLSAEASGTGAYII